MLEVTELGASKGKLQSKLIFSHWQFFVTFDLIFGPIANLLWQVFIVESGQILYKADNLVQKL